MNLIWVNSQLSSVQPAQPLSKSKEKTEKKFIFHASGMLIALYGVLAAGSLSCVEFEMTRFFFFLVHQRMHVLRKCVISAQIMPRWVGSSSFFSNRRI